MNNVIYNKLNYNKFELILIAAKRAKDLALKLSTPLVDPLNDKVTIIALREIQNTKNINN
jgi:DNA-directed RNA polymerase omega subunit